jgi:hypothetical protein
MIKDIKENRELVFEKKEETKETSIQRLTGFEKENTDYSLNQVIKNAKGNNL